MERRVGEMIMLFWRGQHAEAVAWLEKIGCKVITRPDEKGAGHYTIDGVTGIRCGLSTGLDPIAVAAQFGFCLFGAAWPLTFPALIPAVNKAWKEAAKEKRP